MQPARPPDEALAAYATGFIDAVLAHDERLWRVTTIGPCQLSFKLPHIPHVAFHVAVTVVDDPDDPF